MQIIRFTSKRRNILRFLLFSILLVVSNLANENKNGFLFII